MTNYEFKKFGELNVEDKKVLCKQMKVYRADDAQVGDWVTCFFYEAGVYAQGYLCDEKLNICIRNNEMLFPIKGSCYEG